MALTIDELNIQIAAESTKATSAIDTLIGRLETLQSKLGVLGSASKKAGSGLEKTAQGAKKADTATNKYANTTNKATKSAKSFTDRLAQKISKTRTLVGAFKSVANTMASWFNESNEYIETLNLFNVTMGDGAEEAMNFAEKVQGLMGIDIAEWMQYQGVFKNLTAGFGVASDKANIMSQNLTQLSYDMASFFNTDVETAFDKLSSAMSGQVKGLREFGIDTTVASLQEYALAKGIDTKVRSMTQAEKSLLRYNYIMEKSIMMQGDMARTIITPANSLRILSAQLTQMKRALGNIISVLAVQFIPYVQAMVEIITDAANALAKLFGFEIPKIDYSGLGGNMSSDFEDAEESLGGVSDSVKKIKKQLMGFDELNIISNPDTDSGSGSGGAGAGGALSGMEPLEYDFLKGLDTSKVDEIKEKMKDILKIVGFISVGIAGWKLGSFLASLLTANAKATTLKETIALLGKKLTLTVGVTLAVTGIVLETKGIISTVKEGLNKINFTEILGGGGSIIAGGALIGKFFGSTLLGSAIGAIVAGVPMFVIGIYDAIVSGLNWLNSILIPAGATIGGAGIGAIIGMLGGPIGAGIGALIGLAVGALTDLGILIFQKWDEIKAFFQPTWDWLYNNIFKPIGDFFAGVATWFYDNVIQPIVDFFEPIFTAIIDGIVFIYKKIEEVVLGVIKAIWSIFEKIGEIFLKIVEIFVALGKAAYTYIIDPIVDWVVGFAKKVYDVAIKPIIDFFVDLGKKAYTYIIQPIFDGVVWLRDKAIGLFKTVGTTVVNFVSNLFKSIINGVIGAIEGMINGFIKMLNGAIGIINKIPGVSITKITELSIPRLAEGGIVNEGQMFIAREAGPELVGNIGRKTAVANNDQIISGIESGVYRAMMAANSTNSGGSQTIRIINEIDGDVVGEKVIQYHNGKVIQTGVSPLLV